MDNILQNRDGKWRIEMNSKDGIVQFGMDSEGTGRQTTNLLAGNVTLTWDDMGRRKGEWTPSHSGSWVRHIQGRDKRDSVTWTVRQDGEDLIWEINCQESISGLCLTLPIDPLIAGVVVLPKALDTEHRALPPWLMVAPDFGHLLIEVESPGDWTCIMEGRRGSHSGPAPKEGVDPRLRGKAWLEATNVPGYVPGRLHLRFCCGERLTSGARTTLRFRPAGLSTPEGIAPEIWKRIRRPYLNNWQTGSTWCGHEKAMVLGNNVLSDPAACSLYQYAEPMVFWYEPVSGIDVRMLLKRSLDYWLDHHVSVQGHVNAFGRMYDLSVSTGAHLIEAAYHYWAVSEDIAWLKARINKLHAMGDYLVRRDIDGDGLIESIQGGNAGTLRDPGRADIWFEMMNFGHKNAYTNIYAYRAFLYLAELLNVAGHPKGHQYYRRIAERLRQAYVKHLLSPSNGWFVSWISLDGEVHDYCHTFVNGLAVAYGIVPPLQGREILSRVIKKSHSIGFDCWHLGIPGNLLPCRRADMIGPPIDLDGEPVKNHWGYWPESLSEEEAFGHRYPNGTIHPPLVWPYLLGLQVAGLDEEADRILDAMITSAEEGLFQNGIVNVGCGGAEHFYINGKTCGYEGYLPESFNFLMACFTRDDVMRKRLLDPLA